MATSIMLVQTVPLAAVGAEATTPQSQSAADSNHTASAGTFVTFDSGRKHLARIVGIDGETVAVRRFDKKSGEWRTKTESRERKICVPLTDEEAELSFPGSVAAWENTGKHPAVGDGEVSRQMSPNLPASVVSAPAFQSVADFLSAYNAKKETIDDLTGKFVDKAGEAKQAQDEILPHLADMQSLLSKNGANHHLVIAVRKQGHKIPWWTEYYDSYKGKLWESLRTMERRIAAYRNDPTEPKPKRERDEAPQLKKADRKVLIEGNHRAVEIVKALEAGCDAKQEIANFKAVMDAERLDDILEAHEQQPDYKGILLKVLQTVADMKTSLPAEFVTTVRELTKPCNFKIALAAVPTRPTNGSATNGSVKKPSQVAPIPQKPPEWSPLEPGKTYTARPHPHGGWGVYEVGGSTVCCQKHTRQDAAWDAIEAVDLARASAPQQISNTAPSPVAHAVDCNDVPTRTGENTIAVKMNKKEINPAEIALNDEGNWEGFTREQKGVRLDGSVLKIDKGNAAGVTQFAYILRCYSVQSTTGFKGWARASGTLKAKVEKALGNGVRSADDNAQTVTTWKPSRKPTKKDAEVIHVVCDGAEDTNVAEVLEDGPAEPETTEEEQGERQ